MKSGDSKADLTTRSVGFFYSNEPEAAEKQMDKSPLALTVVYNNIPGDPALKESWGFAVWIEDGEGAVLFDTGSDGDVLLENIISSGIDLTRLHTIVISHEHWDHINGLPVITSKLNRQIQVLVPADIENKIRALVPQSDIIPITGPQCITAEIWTTGPLHGTHRGGKISEQSLLINIKGKSYLVTGCSHPGIKTIASFVKEHFPDNDFALITGGFHMAEYEEEEVNDVIDYLASLNVHQIAPTHCTGDAAMQLFRDSWKENYLNLGLGESLMMG